MAGRPSVGTGRLLGMACGPTTACPPMSASAHAALFNGSSGRTLEADMWSALNFPVDSLEISPRRIANAYERRNRTIKGRKIRENSLRIRCFQASARVRHQRAPNTRS